MLSSDDFTEDRNDEKLIKRFPDEPIYSLFDFTFFVASFMKLFTDLLQHRFSSPIPLQFFLFYEHFYVVITLSCAIKIEGLGFLIICMRRFNVLLQMLSTGMACTSIIKLTQILLTETLIEKYQVITKIVPLGVINRMFWLN